MGSYFKISNLKFTLSHFAVISKHGQAFWMFPYSFVLFFLMPEISQVMWATKKNRDVTAYSWVVFREQRKGISLTLRLSACQNPKAHHGHDNNGVSKELKRAFIMEILKKPIYRIHMNSSHNKPKEKEARNSM